MLKARGLHWGDAEEAVLRQSPCPEEHDGSGSGAAAQELPPPPPLEPMPEELVALWTSDQGKLHACAVLCCAVLCCAVLCCAEAGMNATRAGAVDATPWCALTLR